MAKINYIEDKNLLELCGKRIEANSEMPNYGICMFIQSKKSRLIPFTLITYQKIDYLLTKAKD
jgi:hypothetical protein